MYTEGGCHNPFGNDILVPKAAGPAPVRGRLVEEAHPENKNSHADGLRRIPLSGPGYTSGSDCQGVRNYSLMFPPLRTLNLPG